MNPVIRLVPLVSLACALGCRVPSIEELGEKYPVAEYTCSERDDRCPQGTRCVDSKCVDPTTLTCEPGRQVSCGSKVGECREGTTTCLPEGIPGVCTGGRGPTLEQCRDEKDNDCDGLTDAFAAQTLAEGLSPDSSTASAWLPGTELALIATTEANGIKLRTLNKSGQLLELGTLAPTDKHRALGPALAVGPDGAVVAWIEPAVSEVTRDQARVFLAKVDKEGRLGSRVTVFSNHSLPFITGVTLAVSQAHVLVLLSTSAISREPAAGETPSRETWVTTLSSNFASPAPISRRLGAPQQRFGLHASVNGQGNGFVVAYEDMGARNVASLIHSDTVPIIPWTLTTEEVAHSPFIVPTGGSNESFNVLYVRVRPALSASEILGTRCTRNVTGAGGVCSGDVALFRTNRVIRRAWMAGPGGATEPTQALFSWQDASKPMGLSVGRLDANNNQRDGEVARTETFGESFFLTPDSRLEAVYLQSPASSDSSARGLFLHQACVP